MTMEDFIVAVCSVVVGFLMLYCYVEVFADGVWVCVLDSSPRTCATVYKRGLK